VHTPRNMCSVHQVVELTPGMWTLHRVARRSASSNTLFAEAPCPTCLQTARNLFQQQFPMLYAASDPSARESA
jgi:hypothetical protein